MPADNTVFVDIEQNTPPWYDWRRFKCSASDAPILMNAAPSYWETRTWAELRARLHAEAAGEPVPAPKIFLDRAYGAGHAAEEAARAWFNDRQGIRATPRCASRDVDGGIVLAASFDAIETAYRVHAEIKTATSPKSKINNLVGDPAALQDDAFAYVRWQLVHHAAVLADDAANYGFHVVVAGVSPAGKRVHGAVAVDPCTLLDDVPPLVDRWTRFLAGHDQERLDDAWREAAGEWLAADDAVKAAQKRQREAKARLLALVAADDDPLHLQQGHGVRVSTYERTDVRWKDVAAHYGLSEDDIRDAAGKTSTVTTVKRSDNTAS